MPPWCVDIVVYFRRLTSGRESGYYHFTDLEDAWAEVSLHPKLQLRIAQFLSELFTGSSFMPSPELISLKLQRDKLKQYQKKVQKYLCPLRRHICLFALNFQIQSILNLEHEIAKQQLAAGHKDRALIALRRRQYQEGLLTKTDGQLENLEQLVYTQVLDFQPHTHPRIVQVSTIEFSLVEVSVLHGLKQGNAVLKEIHKELNLESVERLLEETAEAREYQRVSSCPASVVLF